MAQADFNQHFDAPEGPAVVSLVNRAVTTGDHAAFGQLYGQFRDRVYHYVYRRLGSQTLAEEVTQQVFLQAWTAIERFRWQGKPFEAWLYTLARNQIVDHVRRIRPTLSLDEDRSEEFDSDAAARKLTEWIDADLLTQAVRQLSPDQQDVIMLRFFENRDTIETARLLGKREGTVRQLQLRALRTLRRMLDDQGLEAAA